MLIMVMLMLRVVVINDHGYIDQDHDGNDDVDQDALDFVLVFASSPHIF